MKQICLHFYHTYDSHLERNTLQVLLVTERYTDTCERTA